MSHTKKRLTIAIIRRDVALHSFLRR